VGVACICRQARGRYLSTWTSYACRSLRFSRKSFSTSDVPCQATGASSLRYALACLKHLPESERHDVRHRLVFADVSVFWLVARESLRLVAARRRYLRTRFYLRRMRPSWQRSPLHCQHARAPERHALALHRQRFIRISSHCCDLSRSRLRIWTPCFVSSSSPKDSPTPQVSRSAPQPHCQWRPRCSIHPHTFLTPRRMRSPLATSKWARCSASPPALSKPLPAMLAGAPQIPLWRARADPLSSAPQSPTHCAGTGLHRIAEVRPNFQIIAHGFD